MTELPDHLKQFIKRLPPWDGTHPKPIVSIGTRTQFGTVKGIRSAGGERFYMLEDEYGTVSLMPANLIEPE